MLERGDLKIQTSVQVEILLMRTRNARMKNKNEIGRKKSIRR